MQRFISHFIPLFLTFAGLAAVAAPAQAQSRQQAPGTNAAALVELNSEHAALAGDWTAVTALSGRSYRLSPSLTNEFNLASAYERGGQSALAVQLYNDVAENGQFTLGAALYANGGGRPGQPAHFNMSDEANRRLSALTGEPIHNAACDQAARTPPAEQVAGAPAANPRGWRTGFGLVAFARDALTPICRATP